MHFTTLFEQFLYLCFKTSLKKLWLQLFMPFCIIVTLYNIINIINLYISFVLQKHFLCTILGPHSSYSCFEIHICPNVERDPRIDPPIHTEYFLSGAAMIFVFMEFGAMASISFFIRSAIPKIRFTLSEVLNVLLVKNYTERLCA